MVDFTLTDEQKNLREMAHDFAEKEIRPVAWEYDKDGTWPADVIQKAWDVGLMNTHIEEQYGGLAPATSTAVDRGGALLGLLGHPDLAWLQRPGHGADRPGWLGGDQEEVPGHAHRIPQACLLLPDRARRRLRRFRDAHDRRQERRQVRHQRLQVLHHQRWLRRLLHGLRQDQQGGRPPRHLCLRGRARLGRRGRQEGGQARQRASNTATISFNDVEVPEENLLGEENAGFKLAMMTLDRTRPGVAAMATGIRARPSSSPPTTRANASSSACRSRCTRGIQFMIADMATEIEAARLLTWKSAYLLDRASPTRSSPRMPSASPRMPR